MESLSFKNITCDLCGSQVYHTVWPENLPDELLPEMFGYAGGKKFRGRVVQCVDCGLKYVNPQPTNLELLYSQVIDEHYLSGEKHRYDNFRRRFREVADRFKGDDLVLDVGCATGIFLDIMKENNCRGEGIEPSLWASGIARSKGYQVYQTSFNDFYFNNKDKKYDVVTAWDVLEHLSSPRSFCEKAYDLLKSGGVLIVDSPDSGLWHAKLLGRFHWLVIMMHIFYFDRKTAKKLFEQVGFTDVRVSPSRMIMPLGTVVVWFKKWPIIYPIVKWATDKVPFLGRIKISLVAGLNVSGVKPLT